MLNKQKGTFFDHWRTYGRFGSAGFSASTLLVTTPLVLVDSISLTFQLVEELEVNKLTALPLRPPRLGLLGEVVGSFSDSPGTDNLLTVSVAVLTPVANVLRIADKAAESP